MIKIDMPMPTNCLDCPACNEYLMCAIPVNGRKWGENDVRDFGQGRPEWCPMKEQDAVKPRSKVRHGANAQIQHFCGNCNSMLHGKPKFCSECGKAVKWE